MNSTSSQKPAVLLIGGLDPQGCAGISADIMTVENHGCHPLPLITALTEQSSQGLTEFGLVSPSKMMAQYENCIADFDIKAIKIGLIPHLLTAKYIKEILLNFNGPIILDPVLASTSGGVTVDDDVKAFIRDDILPLVTLITPNLPELTMLTGNDVSVEEGAKSLRQLGVAACLIKGGHAEGALAIDYFSSELADFYLYNDKTVDKVRGTGCVLASALASQLACGQDIRDAVVLAKAYVSRGIRLSAKAGSYQVIHHSQDEIALVDFPKLCYQPELISQTFDFPRCPELGIYPVVDNADWVKKLIDEGVDTIQLRVKDLDNESTNQQIVSALHYLQGKSIQFFVNDHWQVAIELGAYGVHLGQEDLHDANLKILAEAGLRLGISTHSYWELARALAVNPSYIALGPIYETTSKQMPFSPQGIERLQQWVNLLKGQYPVVAIGGITLERAEQLKVTGVGSVAMITAITRAKDYKYVTQQLLDLWQ
ncbi:thiamine phosphate synthase [Methylophaga sulfidovorans]|uniref:Thiamine-phosphate synthase n=1 Tax=Methylophaga sulfidovorans TaxID=45496 RepID=A0A1I3ZIR8_9GAMM|nr:thiamine phosphate synthase [Methylophaga sulfidovorans]SFK43935.1 thiamine-phosphate diphosphorylase [Methylophaga sulfidovorans]